MVIRVFNYNTMEKVAKFEAHTDYIRYIEVHPTLPYFITTSDDLEINLWDWDKGFASWEEKHGYLTGQACLLSVQEPQEDQASALQAASLALLTDPEVRVRTAAGAALGALCRVKGPGVYSSHRCGAPPAHSGAGSS